MSPRSGPRRPLFAIKMSQSGIDWIRQRAVDEGLTKTNGGGNASEMARIMLAYAAAKMPAGWRPK